MHALLADRNQSSPRPIQVYDDKNDQGNQNRECSHQKVVAASAQSIPVSYHPHRQDPTEKEEQNHNLWYPILQGREPLCGKVDGLVERLQKQAGGDCVMIDSPRSDSLGPKFIL